MEEAEFDLRPAAPIHRQVHPPASAIQAAVPILLQAKNPVILAGSRVTEQGAMAELIRVAELLGAPVISESGTTHGRGAFPSDHPLQADGLPLWSPEVLQRLQPYDAALVVGMDLLRQYVYFEPANPIPAHLQLIHIDEDAYQLNKNYPLAAAIWGNTRASLHDLANALAEQQDASSRATAQARTAQLAAAQQHQRQQLLAQVAAEQTRRPLTPLTLMEAISRTLPRNVAVIEEAVTTTNRTLERLGRLPTTDGYLVIADGHSVGDWDAASVSS